MWQQMKKQPKEQDLCTFLPHTGIRKKTETSSFRP